MRKDAHRHCRFWQWYYDRAPEKLQSHPAFAAIEATHKRMHQMAAELLQEAEAKPSLDPHMIMTSSSTPSTGCAWRS
ncbi:MAG: CZB domain-containing protein [Nitrospirae bacterium]|nr:CZB domain-containing protein [Nitrospirota bacterium]